MSASATWTELGIHIRENGRIEQRVPCPQCAKNERDDTLGVNTTTGAYHCFRCGYRGRAGVESNTPIRPFTRIDDAAAERKRERLRKTWRATVELTHPSARAVRQYLAARGLAPILESPPRILRAHLGLPYFDGSRELGLFPAMVALFSDSTGRAVTLHVTYLHSDGMTKAPVPSPKKILGVPTRGATKGGAIRLHEPRDGVLGVAEGIESALSLHLLQRIPVWAAFCADNLERLRLPAELRELYVGVDVDVSGKGEEAACKLAERARRLHPPLRVFLVVPPGEGPRDLNDGLRCCAPGRAA